MNEVYITRLGAWTNGIENSCEWDEWAAGKRKISSDSKGPEITFTGSLFQRRLSQLSKMTIKVIHDILPINENTKIFFISFRGEICRQFQMSKMLFEENNIGPAVFSLSVFNAPVALACMAMQLKGGYAAIYPGKDSFTTGLNAVMASFLNGTEEAVFVYADEMPPQEYIALLDKSAYPLAFALLLTREKRENSVLLSSLLHEEDNSGGSFIEPEFFLKRLLLRGGIHAAA